MLVALGSGPGCLRLLGLGRSGRVQGVGFRRLPSAPIPHSGGFLPIDSETKFLPCARDAAHVRDRYRGREDCLIRAFFAVKVARAAA